MPELPEVENVKLSLESQGLAGQTFARIEFLRANLRTRLKPEICRFLPGQTVQSLHRRAKYLLWQTENFTILSHLGMTGSWRFIESQSEFEKHDHVVLHFQSGRRLVFNDPRRFGIFDLIKKHKVGQSRWLKHLGPEPLEASFNGEFLFALTRKRKAPIKALLMDQRHVVGVGNIYASEALYAARVRPTRPAGKITREESERLVHAIREILQRAIAEGGSTIKDYRNSQGESGRFQAQFLVYDRAGEPCVQCAQPLRAKVIAGRNTFWCSRCQR